MHEIAIRANLERGVCVWAPKLFKFEYRLSRD